MKTKSANKKTDIFDVAKLAGVSIATVSRVLTGNGPVSEKSRKLVQDAAERLGYHPNESGRALRTQRTGAVGLLISNIQNTFYASIAWEIEQQLTALGIGTLLGNTNEDAQVQDNQLEEITSRNVAGILMLCPVQSPNIKRLLKGQTCIFINRRLTSVKGQPFIGIDDYLAARDLATAIYNRGARRVALLHGPVYSHTSAERLRGVREVFSEMDVVTRPDWVIESKLTIEAGYQSAAALFNRERDFDAIFCGNDQIAYGTYRRCRELSIRVPEDLAIYGFDDNPMNQWLAPWLNTVRVPAESYARETVSLLKEMWDGGTARDIVVPYELVIRS